MNKLRLIAATSLALAGCDAADFAKMETDKLTQMGLTPEQMSVAKALIEGYKKEVGRPVIRSRDVMRAGCYAKTVDLPAHHSRVHKLYIADYAVIDQNYYPWFNKQGIDDQTAYEIGNKVTAAYEECSLGSQIRKRLSR